MYVGVGLGLLGNGIEVLYKDKNGKSNVATVTTAPECGSVHAVQFVLMETGFLQPSDVDGVRGNRTNAALVAYAITKGIVHMPGSPPSGALCEAIQDDYMRLHPEINCPKGSWGVPPVCIPGGPPKSGDPCPPPMTGTYPSCVLPGLPGGTPPPGGDGTTPGWTLPPIPGFPPTTQPPTTTPPTTGGGGGGVIDWFASQGTVTKVAIVGGAAAGLYGLYRYAQKKQLFRKAAA